MNINNPVCKRILFCLLRHPAQTQYDLSKRTGVKNCQILYWLRGLEKEKYVEKNAKAVRPRYSLSSSVIPELRVRGGGITLIISEDDNEQTR